MVIQVYNELEEEEQDDVTQDGTDALWESEVRTKLFHEKNIISRKC